MARLVLFLAAFCSVYLGFASGTLLGGVEEVDKKDAGLLKAVNYATDLYNLQSNNLYRSMAEEIRDATKQIVAGQKYCVVVTMGTSRSCRNDEEHLSKTLEECPVDTVDMVCKFDIVVVPWEKPPADLLHFDCAGLKEKDLTCERPGRKMDPKAPNDDSANEITELAVEPQDAEEEALMSQFNDFIHTYKRTYAADKKEYMHRLKIFQQNLKKAEKMQKMDSGTAKYGVTQFSDLTEEEFKQQYTMPRGWGKPEHEMKQADIPTGDIPDSVDWRAKGVVTPVKNQGSCGSCWAFSTTGNVEGQYAIKTGKLLSLSEQELVDCDKVDHGCEGGLPANAYKQIEKLGGLELESEYPYQGRDSKCKFNKADIEVTINSSVAISKDENEMAAWLAKNGPISIGINANAMQFYMGGVAHPWKIFCSPSSLDHGVLIVGYGVKKGILGSTPYWIIKNSWGASWGVQGYYLIYRGGGCCGLNNACTSAVID